MTPLTGKVALVTGASSGIGGATAIALARAGAAVALGARRVDRLEAVAAGLRGWCVRPIRSGSSTSAYALTTRLLHETAPGHDIRTDADEVMAFAGRPWAEAKCFRPCSGGRARRQRVPHDHHTPTGVGLDIDLVHLECDRLPLQGGVPFGAASGKEEDLAANEDECHWQYGGNVRPADPQPANTFPMDKPQALGFVQDFQPFVYEHHDIK